LVDPNRSNLDNARAGGRDSELLQHYRTCISHHIAERIGDEDVFETQARNYPPVSHTNPPRKHCPDMETALPCHDGPRCA
jgi:hypothetical protein